MKEKYLISLKNELMMQGLSYAEIHEILTDASAYFDNVEKENSAPKAVLEQLGTPKEFAKCIQQSDTLHTAKNSYFCRRMMFLMIPITFLAGIFLLLTEKRQFLMQYRQIIASISIIISMLLIWFLSGNACLLGILPLSKKHIKRWGSFQIFLIIFMIALLYSIYIGVPVYIKMQITRNMLYTVGPVVHFGTVVCMLINIGIAVYCFVSFLKIDWLMFGIFTQSIGLLYCTAFYNQYLRNLTEFDNMHYFPIPLLLSVLASSIIYIMIFKYKNGRQNGCAD